MRAAYFGVYMGHGGEFDRASLSIGDTLLVVERTGYTRRASLVFLAALGFAIGLLALMVARLLGPRQ